MDRQNKLKALIVDADIFYLLAIGDLLSLLDVFVVKCENVELAQKELLKGEHQFDFIIITLLIPQMNGLELLKYIKNEKQFQSIPVFMTSSDEEDANVRAACMEAGAFDFIIKPFRTEKLRQCIEQVRKHKQE